MILYRRQSAQNPKQKRSDTGKRERGEYDDKNAIQGKKGKKGKKITVLTPEPLDK